MQSVPRFKRRAQEVADAILAAFKTGNLPKTLRQTLGVDGLQLALEFVGRQETASNAG